MKGSTFRRCGCRDDQGQPVKDCPRIGRERSHGSWFYRADAGKNPETGRRREERKGGFRTQKEAQEKLTAVLDSVNTGEHRHDGKQTVGTFLTGWLERKVEDGAIRPSTERDYRRHVEQYLVPVIGQLRLQDLHAPHVDRLLRDLRRAGMGPTTVRRVQATLRSALTAAKDDRLVPYNANAEVKLPVVNRPKVHPWEPAELATFLDHAAAHRLGAVYEVMAFTGLRRGEVAGLRWSDVDLEAGVIVVRTQLVVVGHGVVEGAPRTKAGDHRRVDIGARVIGVLIVHQIDQAGERDGWGAATPKAAGCSPARTVRTCTPSRSPRRSSAWSRPRGCGRCACTTCATVRRP